MDNFRVFDFHRMFLGDAPPLYLLEIIFRTIVMYAYTVFLLRVLGKRGMGQMSMLELAIIISFGSAVGDPMIGADIPIVHGVLAITVVTIIQISFERLINKNRKIEALMEGQSNVLVKDGVINWEDMKKDNLSKEDLFRSLRQKDVEHLGQVKKAFFETSGAVSVFFQSPQKISPGLSLEPEEMIRQESIFPAGTVVNETGFYCCLGCGHTKELKTREKFHHCEICASDKWTKAAH